MKAKVLLTLTLSFILSLGALAQQKEKRFALEISGGPSFPTSEFVEGIRIGFGFEGTVQYRFLPFTSVYGGWGANWLSTESSNSENNMDYEETGYVLGLDFRHPISNSNLSYYVRAGALYNHIETENSAGDIIVDSGHGPGFQLAGGLDINLGKNWSLTPGLKFNFLPSDTESEGTTMHFNYQYISARIGISKKF
jgi:opacity protein-like surface antigen